MMKRVIIGIFAFPLTLSFDVDAKDKPEFVLKLSAIAPENTDWARKGYEAREYIKQKSEEELRLYGILEG